MNALKKIQIVTEQHKKVVSLFKCRVNTTLLLSVESTSFRFKVHFL